jgi:hypothetical protein
MAQTVNADRVYALSRGILGREPDSAGMTNYINLAKTGATEDQILTAMGLELKANGRYSSTGIFAIDSSLVAKATAAADISEGIKITVDAIGKSNPFQFDEKWYLEHNPDVAAAVKKGAFTSGLDHYEKYGKYAGRISGPQEQKAYDDATKKWEPYYTDLKNTYADQYNTNIKRAKDDYEAKYGKEGSEEAAKNAFLAQQEFSKGQIDKTIAEMAQDFAKDYGKFDEADYLRRYPEVAKAVAEGKYASGEAHYQAHGAQEGRKASYVGGEKEEEKKYYLATEQANKDKLTTSLARANQDFQLKYGDFDEQAYLKANPGVAQEIAEGKLSSGLQHYLKYGINEGRKPYYTGGSAEAEKQAYLESQETQKARTAEDLKRYLQYMGGERGSWMEEWADTQKRAQEAIGETAADTGLFYSSQREKQLADQARAAERQRAGYERGYQYQTGGAQLTAGRTQEDINRQIQDYMRQYNVDLATATNAINRYQQDIAAQQTDIDRRVSEYMRQYGVNQEDAAIAVRRQIEDENAKKQQIDMQTGAYTTQYGAQQGQAQTDYERYLEDQKKAQEAYEKELARKQAESIETSVYNTWEQQSKGYW